MQRVLLSLFSFFLVVELAGLYIGSKLIALPEIEPQQGAAAGVGIFLYIIFVTILILVLIKYVRKTLKVFELLVIFISTSIFFNTVFLGHMPAWVAEQTAFLLALLIVVLRYLEPNYWTQNVAVVFSIIGAGALLGAWLGFLPALVLLLLLTGYDYIAVFKTKHMVTMAKEIIKQKLAFTMAVPTPQHVFQLGTGDLIIPLVFTVAVLRSFGLQAALSVIIGSMVGLVALFWYLMGRAKRPLPALPAVTAGALLGLGVFQALSMIGV